MVSPGREMSTAVASQGVDLHAGERPPVEPDHLPPPHAWEPEPAGSITLYVGIALVAAVVLLILFL